MGLFHTLCFGLHSTTKILIIDKVQHMATNIIAESKYMTYKDGLRELSLFSLEKRKWGILLLLQLPNERLQRRWNQTGKAHSLHQQKFWVDTRKKKTFTVKLVRHWDKLPREAMEFPFLGIFRPQLDMTLDNMI